MKFGIWISSFGFLILACNIFATVTPTLAPQPTPTTNRFPTLPPTSTSQPPIALTPRVTPTTQPPTPTAISNQLSVNGHIVFT
ncbi:MAG: hypothetical protein AAB261_03545, partial [Chloroflexota bacterium]